MKTNDIFLLCLGLTLVAGVPQFISIRNIVSSRQHVNSSYPKFVDFWRSLVVAVAICFFQRGWEVVVQPLSAMVTYKKNTSSAFIRELKVHKVTESAFKCLYFITISVYAYVILRKAPYFPTQWGGRGDVTALWTGYPMNDAGELIKWYFYVNAGYHVSRLYFVLTEIPMPDFWENVVQLTLALSLTTFGYVMNHMKVGALLMFSHDVCDIFTCAVKALVNTSAPRLTIAVCGILMVCWTYFRLWCLVTVVLNLVLREMPKIIPPGASGFVWFAVPLLMLLMLNIYWFCLMLKSVWLFLTSGTMSDLHSRVSEADLKGRYRSTMETLTGKKESDREDEGPHEATGGTSTWKTKEMERNVRSR